MSKPVVLLLIAGAAMAGIYVVALAMASTMSPTFNTTETVHHSGLREFVTSMKRASLEYQNARAKCELVPEAQKQQCDSRAIADQQRARSQARFAYRNGAAADDEVIFVPRVARNIDAVLYRVHRQLP